MLANAEILASRLLPLGWDTVVIDIDWSDPSARAHGYNREAPLAMDANGRLIPDVGRFPSSSGGAGTVVRRILLFLILYALVVIAVIGLSGLVERIIGPDRDIAGDDSGLARSLAFTLIGVPLAAALWWWQRRRLMADAGERGSLVWALYLTAMSLTALIQATVSLGSAATAGIDGEWRRSEEHTSELQSR